MLADHHWAARFNDGIDDSMHNRNSRDLEGRRSRETDPRGSREQERPPENPPANEAPEPRLRRGSYTGTPSGIITTPSERRSIEEGALSGSESSEEDEDDDVADM